MLLLVRHDLFAMALQTPDIPGQNQFSPKVFTLLSMKTVSILQCQSICAMVFLPLKHLFFTHISSLVDLRSGSMDTKTTTAGLHISSSATSAHLTKGPCQLKARPSSSKPTYHNFRWPIPQKSDHKNVYQYPSCANAAAISKAPFSGYTQCHQLT